MPKPPQMPAENRKSAAAHIREIGNAFLKSADMVENAVSEDEESESADLFMAAGMHAFEHVAKRLAEQGIMGGQIVIPMDNESEPRTDFFGAAGGSMN